jgi:hypothetical protein
MYRQKILLVVAGIALAFGVAACGDDGNDAEEWASVRASLDAINQASLKGDAESFLKYITPRGLETVIFATEEEVREFPVVISSESEGGFFKVGTIKIDGEKAVVTEGPRDDLVLFAPRALDMIKEGGVWKIDGGRMRDAGKPDGAVTVPVKMGDFHFEIDDSRFRVGKPVLFEVKNDGTQPHHFVLFKLAPGVDLEAALAAEGEVPGFEHIGGVGVWKPGESSDVALTRPLEAGSRYVFVCFLPDTSAANPAEAPPHFVLGMVHEVTVK